MLYSSLHNRSAKVSFREAVIRGLAPDKGLYYPDKISPLDKDIISGMATLSNEAISYHAISQFVEGEIPEAVLSEIISETLDFPFPLVEIAENIYSLELFHGPTMAFKDVGACFMARCLGYFKKGSATPKLTVLVATSGDTGGAVANGFLGVEGVEVVILFPSGRVSDIQERQLTTLEQNIKALEVKGTFDDCQAMVKKAFLDNDLKEEIQLTSANSINIARWLPQMFYYFFAYKQLLQLKNEDPLVVSVPSGNFGNICAGMVAHQLGLPIEHFIASTNINDTVPQYLETGIYEPKASVSTISNAMDVGDPSNFVRIRKLVNNDIHKLKTLFSSHSFTDKETKKAMKLLFKRYRYIADPHGCVGYLGLETYRKEHPETVGVFLETAHPVKFIDVVESTLKTKVTLPGQIAKLMNRKKKSILIRDYLGLKNFLLQSI